MKKWSNRISIVAVCVAIAAAFYVFTRETPVSVDLHAIDETPMQVSIEADGVACVK